MLEKAKNVLCEQLQRNLAEQDYYKNICTEIMVKNETVMHLMHPSVIVNERTGEEVFPERAQNDIDKEFDPMIALCFSFSMKEQKQQLERFKARSDFGEFREVKDFGARMYAIDFGTDVEKATEKCVDILRDIYEVEKLRNFKITTGDMESGEVYAKKTIFSPQSEPFKPKTPKRNAVVPKVVGVATRVVEDEPTALPLVDGKIKATQMSDTEKGVGLAKKSDDKDISDKTYKKVMWLIGIVVASFLFFVIMKYRQSEPQPSDMETVVEETVDSVEEATPLSAEQREAILGKSKPVASEEQPKKEEPKTESVGKWRETGTGDNNHTWVLEKNLSNGQYVLKNYYQEQFFQQHTCIRKKIKRSKDYLFHDVRNEQTFTLKAGSEIFFIPNFDNDANGILVINGSTGYLYTNDINPRVYDFFATLQPIY
ncbi:hypothetical protein [Hoylesella timonensis]|uniref:Uncharacterized protein n=1 Tax=Hoylesella timonensis S9-PR14 TaxID=1401062 RepID=A0A098YQY3_9BACT|nr:hypothetical protein [Hoylesella timonensis]KGI21734.1 hypothetical protein HMPREF9304_08545 [Hoylesella timonensis S9-PR14]